jgi:hypothetical protein
MPKVTIAGRRRQAERPLPAYPHHPRPPSTPPTVPRLRSAPPLLYRFWQRCSQRIRPAEQGASDDDVDTTMGREISAATFQVRVSRGSQAGEDDHILQDWALKRASYGKHNRATVVFAQRASAACPTSTCGSLEGLDTHNAIRYNPPGVPNARSRHHH